MGHFKALKDADPRIRLVVMGCLAEQDRDRMRSAAPHVDDVFGTKELAELGDRLATWRPEIDERRADDAEYAEERALLMPLGGSADAVVDAFSHLRAFVTVQRGCSYYCTFCIVPHVRGRFDHRPASEIVEEVREKIASGAREIMLVGQTVNAWRDPADGRDFATSARRSARSMVWSGSRSSRRIRKILPRVPSPARARPGAHPRVHLPLQSAATPCCGA